MSILFQSDCFNTIVTQLWSENLMAQKEVLVSSSFFEINRHMLELSA